MKRNSAPVPSVTTAATAPTDTSGCSSSSTSVAALAGVPTRYEAGAGGPGGSTRSVTMPLSSADRSSTVGTDTVALVAPAAKWTIAGGADASTSPTCVTSIRTAMARSLSPMTSERVTVKLAAEPSVTDAASALTVTVGAASSSRTSIVAGICVVIG